MKLPTLRQNDKIFQLLEILDLHGKEKDVYILCLQGGPLPASSIAKAVNVHRAAVYQLINQLIKKGFLYQEKNAKSPKIQLFNAVGLEKLKDILNQKKLQLDSLESQLLQLLKYKKYSPAKDNSEIKTFNTPYSLKQVFLEAVCESKEKIYLISSIDSPLNIFDRIFFGNFFKELSKKKIKLQIIIPSQDNILNSQKNIWIRNGVEWRTFRTNNFPFGSGILVSDSFLFLFSWNPQNPQGIKISDETIRQTYTALFLLLWEKFSDAPKKQKYIYSSSMKIIPAGYFHYGDGINSKKIFVNSFLMDITPVTNIEYQKFVREAGYPTPIHWKNNIYPKGKTLHPVINVSLVDARAYATWADKRLPTDEEWEKAARGNDRRIYPWGNTFNVKFCNILRIHGGTTPVKSYPLGRSYYNLYDMAGNIWEWTESATDEEQKLYILKGGSWSNNETTAQCSYKTVEYAEKSYDNIGFRCVKDVL